MNAESVNLMVDEDGFVCVVAPDSYEGFVNSAWTLDLLLARFAQQMNRGALFIAYPGPDRANAALGFGTEALPTSSGRTVSGIVQVGDAGLWLTDYTQLTMAAQFSDETPITRFSQRLSVAPGRYLVTLHEGADGDLTLTVAPTTLDAVAEQSSVPWFA